VKEEDAKAAKVAEYLHRRHLIANSNDPEGCPGYNTVHMALLNDKDARRETSMT
jgi:hypothetical protein